MTCDLGLNVMDIGLPDGLPEGLCRGSESVGLTLVYKDTEMLLFWGAERSESY